MEKEFLIYDTLLSEISPIENSEQIDWIKLCSLIKCLNEEDYEIIYAMILHHFLKENGHRKIKWEIIPYNGKTIDNGRGPMYNNPGNLPYLLQKIIERYILKVSEE